MVNVENQIFVFQDSSPVDLNSKTLRIIHFNDVYNIEGFDTEPFGGAARFKTAIDFFQNKKNLVLFSGDAFSPSTLSLFSKGTQMIECLNKFKINAAVVGNHEFDMGVDIFKELVELSNFPWILTNLYDAETMKPFLDLKTQRFHRENIPKWIAFKDSDTWLMHNLREKKYQKNKREIKFWSF
ncbi:mannosylglucosyl-3-phosphoglycerate phosphatase isoform X2 [Brachionus plicatilis]|uniref:Mannosylglucosyl-3-phosphoglycerate phosphatase isoform X2 n=1 Tax=Brachionus plicatilis TaxID=10195 RepID=A0A3M7S4B4_BRAPC|nr:mannosylglucosyl-3-phosphoglycerate phosphatase isoform X2 [Brachionus plicatilis]